MKKFLSLFIIVILLSSCSEFEKALKSEDIDVKYKTAAKLFEAKKYSKALRLYEQIAPSFKGKPEAESMYYMYAQSYYNTGQFRSAAYQFESYASSYPKSEKCEIASFYSAKCYTTLSPSFSLDQNDTDKAIDKLQNFIDTYPDSQYLQESNKLMKDLKFKLEKKSFEIAKQYNTISDFKSALISFDNFISDFPGTTFKEDALFYKLDSAYKLAVNSVPEKMEERLQNAKTAYVNLNKFTQSSKHKKNADEMLASIDKELQKFSK
jgi:outer membrane protein assembly factor BamD